MVERMMARYEGCMMVIVLAVTVSSSVRGYTVNLVVVNREAREGEGLTCWTCPNKTDNEACNDWAPDITCPHGHSWCKTVHRMDTVTGETVFVDKRCVMAEQCAEPAVGCHATQAPGVQDCVTCCNEDYCNEHVPSNHTAAYRLSSYYGNSASASHRHHFSSLLTLILVCALTLS